LQEVTAQGIMDQQESLLVRTTLPHNITCTPIFFINYSKGWQELCHVLHFCYKKKRYKPTTRTDLPTATTTRHHYTQLNLTKKKMEETSVKKNTKE